MKRSIFCCVLLFFFVCRGSAEQISRNGVLYNLLTYNKEAQVAGWDRSSDLLQNGVLNIPSTISHQGSIYAVKKINYCAFENCNFLQEVTISEGIEKIEFSAFQKCANLVSVSLPKSLLIIGNYVFNSCVSLTSIIVPEGVQELGELVFKDCEKLQYAKIPSSLKILPKCTFAGCKSLTNVDFEEGVLELGGAAFDGCKSLLSILLPSSLTTIDKSVFSGCSSLESIHIPNNVTTLDRWVFLSCRSLQTIHLGRDLSRIDAEVFAGCDNLKEIIISEENKNFIVVDDVLYSHNMDRVILCAKAKEGHISIPLGVESIEQDAFGSCKKITSISIPSTVRTIKEGGISECVRLESIVIEEGLENIGKYAFSNCKKLTSLQIPSSVKNIDDAFYGCSRLEYLTIHNPNVNIGENAFEECDKLTIYVPKKSVESFKKKPALVGKKIEEDNISAALASQPKNQEKPLLQIVDFAVTGNGTLLRKQPFDLQLLLQNTQYGKAEDVIVSITLPTNVLLMDGQEQTKIPTMPSGDKKVLDYQLIVSSNYNSEILPIQVSIREKYGKYAENKTIELKLNQQLASNALSPFTKKTGTALSSSQETISEVDANIPSNSIENMNTFVVIIANQEYIDEVPVSFAQNDGQIFKEYCLKTLGIPQKNIKFRTNATLNQIKAEVTWLHTITNVFDNPKIIFYYAGHGIPDESNKSAYLLPVDGNGTDVTTGYKLDDLYATLGNMPASHITVFMDACFSGSQRGSGMLASARGVALKSKAGVPQGNMVVFSAAQGDETAYPNNEQGHGMFTYYLLKKLQETKGDVTLKDLGDYITTNVSQQSIVLNSKSQTPCVTPASAVADSWQSWKLK